MSQITQTAEIAKKLEKQRKKNPYSLGSRIKQNSSSYVLLAPFMTFFTIFTVLPVILAFVLSFTYFNMLEFPKFIGWDNYLRLFLNDDVFVIAIKNTMLFSLITGPTSYFACLMFAWFVNEMSPKARTAFTFIFYAPSLAGGTFMLWSYIFSSDYYGLANGMLMKLGLITTPIQWFTDPKYSMGLIIMIQLWMSLGTSFLMFIAGLQTQDRTLYEAGAIDGIKNRWQELWFLTLPILRPHMMLGAVLQIAASFTVSGVITQFAGTVNTNYTTTTVLTHAQDFAGTRLEMGYASAICTVLFIVMVFTKNLISKVLQQD